MSKYSHLDGKSGKVERVRSNVDQKFSITKQTNCKNFIY